VSVRFGVFTLDTDGRLLRRDEAEVHLTPKAFDLLALLIQEAPRVLRKAELHEQLWPETFVSDATLVGLIKELRRALDDRDATSRLIRTAFGVGYAFCGAVERPEAPPGRRQPDVGDRSCWIVAGSRKIPLGEGEHVIGRDPASTVWLDVPGVSRRHARIVIDRAAASIEDLESKNGTTLREQEVTRPSPLRDGDRIQVGPILVVFHTSASGLSTATLTGRASQPRKSRKSPTARIGRRET
jgi:DNA-binding winged helix-turn-helix (wHTH) protein